MVKASRSPTLKAQTCDELSFSGGSSQGLFLATFVIALLISLFINIGLPIIYLTYLQKLEDRKCECAITHELFQTMRYLVIAQLACTVVLPLIAIIPRQLRAGVSIAVGIAHAITFMVWFRAMGNLRCLCSDSWEKKVWVSMSVLYLSFLAMSILALLLTALTP